MLRRLATLITLALTLLTAGIVAAPAASAVEPTPVTVNDPELIGHDWTLLSPRTMTPAVPGAHVQITWGGVMKGTDGCNDFWGRATVDGVHRTVTFDVEGSTRRLCIIGGAIDAYSELQGTHAYYVYGGRLTLVAQDGSRHSFTRA